VKNTNKFIKEYENKEGLLKNSGKCRDCGEKLSLSSTQCIKYKGKKIMKQNKGNRPPAETLKKLLETMTKISIGQKYNVSEAAVRNWIKTYKKHDMWD